MDILILGFGTPRVSQTYRGTDRVTPYYVDSLSEDHQVNQCFLWYCEEGGELGVVHNFTRAKELVLAYHELRPPQHFEIVEVAKNGDHQSSGEFLGFDLSAGYNDSLLSWGLEIGNARSSDSIRDDRYLLIQPLLHLIQEFFQKKLNSNGLFDNYEDASFCLDCMMALQGVYPSLWENEDVKFEVVGLWVHDNVDEEQVISNTLV